MSYAVKELFLTIQGEGGQTGRAAVFCRFSGCNLWSGRESDRSEAVCSFCDTDFVGVDGVGGGRFVSAEDLSNAALQLWRGPQSDPKLVVFTGGEPLLQLDDALLSAFKALGFETAVETNGTLKAPVGLDWVCVSPKGSAQLVQIEGEELKLVHPQVGIDPAAFEALNFRRFLLQPMDGPHLEDNTRATLDYCLRRPLWRFSAQTHKFLGIP